MSRLPGRVESVVERPVAHPIGRGEKNRRRLATIGPHVLRLKFLKAEAGCAPLQLSVEHVERVL